MSISRSSFRSLDVLCLHWSLAATIAALPAAAERRTTTGGGRRRRLRRRRLHGARWRRRHAACLHREGRQSAAAVHLRRGAARATWTRRLDGASATPPTKILAGKATDQQMIDAIEWKIESLRIREKLGDDRRGQEDRRIPRRPASSTRVPTVEQGDRRDSPESRRDAAADGADDQAPPVAAARRSPARRDDRLARSTPIKSGDAVRQLTPACSPCSRSRSPIRPTARWPTRRSPNCCRCSARATTPTCKSGCRCSKASTAA